MNYMPVYNRGKNVTRPPDFEYEGVKYWWKEMTSQEGSCRPLKIKYFKSLDMVIRMHGSWGTQISKHVTTAYKDWQAEKHLLGVNND